MAFPTIPTVAATRILTNNQADTNATRTFPSLTGLTKNAGDLLIAIIVGYQTGTGTNAAFSGWSAGWTEFHDSATATTIAVGMAYKWSNGSETGTIAVTQAGTITGYASMILLSIPGAHATSPPEAGGRASGTGAANPTAVTPSWGAADTLWIAVAGHGETSISGTWTGIASAPANFSGYADTAKADTSTVGETEAAVAFRQFNASSLDVGTFTADTSNSRDAAVVIAVRNAPVTLYGVIERAFTFTKAVAATKKTFGQIASAFTFTKAVSGYKHLNTSVAEISLASSGEPTERTNHSIKIRARTTSGSTGVIKAALYEGATNRSGDLTSTVLTNSLVDYTLAIPDASAANITDYSNLSIRFWGYDSAGNALVFEVADIYLQLPESTGPATLYGAIVSPFTFAKSVSGKKETFGQIASSLTFAKSVLATKKTFGQIAAPFTFAKDVSGAKKTFGQVVTSIIFIKETSATKQTFGQVVAPFMFAKDVSGVRTAFGQITFDIINSITTAGSRVGNTLFGVVDFPIIFIKDVSARRTTFGQVVAPFTFTKAVNGIKTTFGQVVAPFTFTKTVNGVRTAFGQIVAPFIFAKDVSARRTTFGQIAAPFTFVKDVSGAKKTFGQVVVPFTFAKDVSGVKTTFGQIILPFIFGKDVSGRKTTFAQIDFPVIFMKEIVARKSTFGLIDFPIDMNFIVVAEVQGIRFGATSMSLIFGKEILATKETFGKITSLLMPYPLGDIEEPGFSSIIFGKDVSGYKTTFGQIDRPFIFTKETSGQRKTFGQLTFPINASFIIAGSNFRTQYGQLAMGLVFDKQIIGQKQTFGQFSTPYLFSAVSEATKTTFSKIEFPIDFIIDVETGKVEAFSQLAFEILISLETVGFMRPEIIILNLAKNIYLGFTPVDSMYILDQKVWPPTI